MSLRIVTVFLGGLLLLAGCTGCGSNPQKGAEQNRDMPKSADKDS